jgi:hypothetical protein
VYVYRLANPKADILITRLSQSLEQAAKAVEVRFAVHVFIPAMIAPSLCRRVQVLMVDNPFCDIDHGCKT